MKRFTTIIIAFIVVLTSWKITSFAESYNILNAYEFAAAMQQFARDNTIESLNTKVTMEQSINRLIVKTNSNKPLKETYGAIDKLEGYGGLHILQYSTKNQTDLAYQSFLKDDIIYVEYDYLMKLNSGNTQYCYCEHNPPNPATQCMCCDEIGLCDCEDNTSEGHNSWNSSAVMVDEAFAYLQTNGSELKQVNIAVLDTGIDIYHKDFSSSNRFVLDKEYEREVVKEGYTSDKDATYHGTHVAGIIFDNTLNNVNIYSYRLFDDTYNFILYSVFSLALNAVVCGGFIDVINMSVGMDPYNDEHENKTLYEILDSAINKNIVIVVAAGNNCGDSNLFIPASYKKAIVVAATNKNNTVDKNYSNYGVNVDVAAPGTDIYSTTPTKVGKVDSNGNEVYISYVRSTGTSMSAPLVSAAAALIKSIDPDITPAEVERIIKETAYVPEGWGGRENENEPAKNYGTGIVNFYNIARAMLGERSATPIISETADNKFEIALPAGVEGKIYYTLDGSEPTTANGDLYSKPLDLKDKDIGEIKAACHEKGKLCGNSAVKNMVTNKKLKLDYKETYMTMPYELAYKGWWQDSDKDIADSNYKGEITGKSPGTSNVVFRLANGERIIYTVTVDYSLWQKIIIYFFFGFLWYI